MTRQENNTDADAAAGEEKEAPAETAKTLGILFVHGIGMQQRGNTLAQCAAAIHSWLRDWISAVPSDEGSISVDLLDTNITQPRANEPAHSRLIFRREYTVSHFSSLFAESCWAETFRPPRYGQFIRWALRVLPLTIVLHLASSYCRYERTLRTCVAVVDKRGGATREELRQLQLDLGPRYRPLRPEDLVEKKIISDQELQASNWFLITPFLVAPLLFVAVVLQILLLAVTFIALAPIDFLRSLAVRVQKTVAGVLGDSYLFVESPICASATVTQVKEDFEWLAKRCDQVVILAHSQGAVVTYRAIVEWLWEGKIPTKLKVLITYGSGLRKLLGLQQVYLDKSPKTTYLAKKAGMLIVGGSIGFTTFGMWLVGIIPFLPFIVTFVLSYISVAVGLIVARRAFSGPDPELPVGLYWVNLFASHDPVPNGPIGVSSPKYEPTGNLWMDKAIKRAGELPIDLFLLNQREVVNLESRIADHTTYWSAKDDFLGSVVMQLLRMSGISSPGTDDAEWLDLSAKRRRWRVGLRTNCRNVAIAAVLCLKFWPSRFIYDLGGHVVHFWSQLMMVTPTQIMPELIRHITIPKSDFGINAAGVTALLSCICFAFTIAVSGWKVWERCELAHFFRREAYKTGGVGAAIFAAGWMGIILVTPVALSMAVGGKALWPSVWSTLFLLTVSCLTLLRSGNFSSQWNEWITTILERGDSLLEQKSGDRAESLSRANVYFSRALKCLSGEKDSIERVQALLGMARVLEEAIEASKDERYQLRALYEEAIASLERMGKETRVVRERLDRLSFDAATSEATRKNDKSPITASSTVLD